MIQTNIQMIYQNKQKLTNERSPRIHTGEEHPRNEQSNLGAKTNEKSDCFLEGKNALDWNKEKTTHRGPCHHPSDQNANLWVQRFSFRFRLSIYIDFGTGRLAVWQFDLRHFLMRPVWQKISICKINFNFKIQKSKLKRSLWYETIWFFGSIKQLLQKSCDSE